MWWSEPSRPFPQDPWSVFHGLFQEAGAQRSSGMGAEAPACEIWTSDEGAMLRVELPGVEANGLELSVLRDTLTIEGSREAEELGEETAIHRRERAQGAFKRNVKLPFQIEAGAIEAELQQGVLNVRLPRAEAEKPRTILVKAG